MPNSNHDFSDRLKHAMSVAGIPTQKQLAEKIGVSANAVTNYIKKGQLPEAQILVKIHNVLDVSTDWLLTGKGPKPAVGGSMAQSESHLPHTGNQDMPGYVSVRLPRGDPGPVPDEDLDYLEKTLVVLRHPPEKGDWAGALKQNISMSYTGVQQSNQLLKPARDGRQRKIS